MLAPIDKKKIARGFCSTAQHKQMKRTKRLQNKLKKKQLRNVKCIKAFEVNI